MQFVQDLFAREVTAQQLDDSINQRQVAHRVVDLGLILSFSRGRSLFERLFVGFAQNTFQVCQKEDSTDVLFNGERVGSAQAFDFKDVFEAIKKRLLVPAPAVDLFEVAGWICLRIEQRRDQNFCFSAGEQDANEPDRQSFRQVVLGDKSARGGSFWQLQFDQGFESIACPKRLARAEAVARQARHDLPSVCRSKGEQFVVGVGSIHHQQIVGLSRRPELFEQHPGFALPFAQAQSQSEIIEQIVEHAGQGLHTFGAFVLIGLQRKLCASLLVVGQIQERAVHPNQPMTTPQPDLIRFLSIIILANDAIEQGESFRLEFLPRVTIGAVSRNLKDSPQCREHFVERVLERQFMTSQNQQSNIEERQGAAPREILRTLPICCNEKRTTQPRPYLSQQIQFIFFFISSFLRNYFR